jgi:hypothetical protein
MTIVIVHKRIHDVSLMKKIPMHEIACKSAGMEIW